MKIVREAKARIILALTSLKKHRKALLIILLSAGILFVAMPVFAQEKALAKVLLQLLARLCLYISQAIGLLAIFEMDIVIKIAEYNNFTNSPTIEMGWVLVRDIVNMFFVVGLLIIAFSTMLNLGKLNWRQALPRLLIAAVLINFSRLICGLFIDVGQVIMLTFVNAVKNTAAGNFIALTQLGSAFSTFGTNNPIASWDIFVSAFIALIMMIVIAVVLLMLIAVFLYRIVMLWVLVILSPLAFFLGGIRDVLAQAGNYYGQWWSKFSNNIIIGPIVMFFLWLALAAAGTGSTLAEEERFNVTDYPEEVTNVSPGIGENTQPKVFVSFLIAVALLLAGLEVAQGAASAIGGLAATAAGKAKAVSGKAVAAPASAAGYVGAKTAGWAKGTTQEGARRGGQALGEKGYGAAAAGLSAVGADKLAGWASQQQGKYRTARQERFDEQVKRKNLITDKDILVKQAMGGDAAAVESVLSNKKQLIDLMKTEEGRSQLSEVHRQSKQSDVLKERRRINPDLNDKLAKNELFTLGTMDSDTIKERVEMMDPSDIKNMHTESIKNPEVLEQLSKWRFTKAGREGTALDHLHRGTVGNAKSQNEFREMAETDDQGNVLIDETLRKARQMAAAGGAAAAGAAAAGAAAPQAPTPEDVVTRLNAGEISIDRVDLGNSDIARAILTSTDVNPEDLESLGMDRDNVNNAKSAMRDAQATGAFNPEEMEQAKKNMFAMSHRVSDLCDEPLEVVYGGGDRFGKVEDAEFFRNHIQNNPNLLVEGEGLRRSVSNNDFDNEIAEEVARAIGPKQLKDVFKTVQSSYDAGQANGGAMYQRELEKLKEIQNALLQHQGELDDAANEQIDKSLRFLNRAGRRLPDF